MPCAHFYVYIFTFLYEYCTLSQTVTYIIIFSIWIRETRFVGNDRKNEKTRFIVFFSTNIVKFDDIFFLFLVNFHTMMQCLTFTSSTRRLRFVTKFIFLPDTIFPNEAEIVDIRTHVMNTYRVRHDKSNGIVRPLECLWWNDCSL